jgi:hypothetical protein
MVLGMTQRIESSVTSVSWIPSEAVAGLSRMVFDSGVTHYDAPLPDVIEDLDALRDADRYRFANRLAAWIEVDGDRIVASGYCGGGSIGSTTVRLGPKQITFAAVMLPDQQATPEAGKGLVRFAQTCGGRTGVPAPRHVKHPPFVQISAPIVWTTLALTIHADGTVEHEVVGASSFPRHWIYDASGRMVAKSGLIDFSDWYKSAFGAHTPWGGEDSPALVTEVETALERELSGHIMRGGQKPRIRELKPETTLVEEGDAGTELFLLLDGVLSVEIDGKSIAQVGPGAVVGERALVEGGTRTATLRAVTKSRVAVVSGEEIDPAFLHTLASGHRREER